jgi:tetratricopeptide (TPR) repeat protein
VFSSTPREAADSFYERANTYYMGKDYARAEDQIAKGLQIDPDHYHLNVLKGLIILRRAKDEPGYYQQAIPVFEKVRSLRRDDRHFHEAFLGLGEAHHGLYQAYRKQAETLGKEAAAEGLTEEKKRELLARVDETQRLFREHLTEAERQYEKVLDSEDMGVMLAHERLAVVLVDKARDLQGAERKACLKRAIEHADKMLADNAQRQKQYEQTQAEQTDPFRENLARRQYRDLQQRERAFRALVSNILYDTGDYAGAKAHLDRVLTIDPNSAADYYNRARCSRARRDLEHFLRLTDRPFESHEVREANQMLQELAGK